MNEKEINTKYIRQFSSISVRNICSDLGFEKDYQNIMNGTTSLKKIKKVREEIERRLAILNDCERDV